MDKDYRPLREVADEWGITVRRVQMLCVQGKLPGAKKIGNLWAVPSDAVRPADKRTLNGEPQKSKSGPKTAQDTLLPASGGIVFLSLLSHDIRISLNAILGSVEMLRIHAAETERVLEYADTIRNAGQNIQNMLSDAVDLGRLQNGQITVQEEAVNLEAMAHQLIEEESERAKAHNVKIQLKTNLRHEFVQADREKLSRILKNILSNAVKFSREDGIVSFEMEEVGSSRGSRCRIRYVIEDHGIGMSESFLKLIYNSFSREGGAGQSQSHGSGLGMAIVRQLTDLLHGTIGIESEPEKGTRVTLTMDHTISDLTEQAMVREMPLDMSEFKGRRVLLAEDNELNRKIAAEVLTEAGFRVECAEDGIICVAMLEKARPGYYDLILMDLMMPNLNGITATRVIRGLDNEKQAGIPIIAMTASVMAEDRTNALKAGMNGFVEKPVHPERLYRAISRVLQ